MELSRALLKDFAKAVNGNSRTTQTSTSVNGTAIVDSSGKKYVQIDGSDQVTPISEITDVQNGDRVLVTIENHQAVVIGNYTYPPSARTANAALEAAEGALTEFQYLSAIAVTTDSLTADLANIGYITAEQANIAYAKITELESIAITTNNLEAKTAELGLLTVDQANANYLTATQADLKYATIDDLNAKTVTAEEIQAAVAKVGYLLASEAALTYATIATLEAEYATIATLEAEYATIAQLDVQVGRIDTLSGDLAAYKVVVAEDLLVAKGWMSEGSIGDAQISSVSANKLSAGTIDTSVVTILGSDGRLQIQDNTIQISDTNQVRVQIGKDSSGDYTLAVWDASGNLIWDALGATENTIQRAIIRDSMVSDDAAIQALKIDFQSFETALTNQGVTISGTVVQVGDKTLNVALTEQTQYVDDSIAGIEIGGRNVIRNSAFINGLKYWSCNGNTSSVDTDRTFNGHPTIKVCNTGLTESRWYGPSTCYLPQTPTSILAGEAWTVSCYYYVEDASTIDGELILEVKGKKEGATSDSTIGRTTSLKSSNTVEGAWTKIKKTFTATEDYSNCHVFAWTSRNGTVWFADFKLEKGNKATDWSPAPEDTESEINDLNTTVATHTSTLSSHETRITANETAISLAVTTQTFEEYKNSTDSRLLTTESSISLLQDEISLKVEQADIDDATSLLRSEIELTETSILSTVSRNYATQDSLSSVETVATQTADSFSWLISGDTTTGFTLTTEGAELFTSELNIDALTTFMNSAQNGTSTVINGGAIQTGTITADKIDVDDLFAQDITASGTITGANLVGGTLSNTDTTYGTIDITSGVVSSTSSVAAIDRVATISQGCITVKRRDGGRAYVNITPVRLKMVPDVNNPVTFFELNSTDLAGNLYGTLYVSGTVTSGTNFKIGSTTYNNGYVELYAGTPFIDFHYGSSTADYTSRIIEGSSGVLTINNLSVGSNYASASTIYTSNWFRSYNSSGWYSETYGGGIHMTDTTWVRVYNGKAFYTAGKLYTSSTFQADGAATFGGAVTISGALTATGAVKLGSQSGYSAVYLSTSCCTTTNGHFRPQSTDGTLLLGTADRRWSWIYSSHSTLTTSDEREKDILGYLEDDKRYKGFFMKLKPIMYRWKTSIDDGRVQVGLGAQTSEKMLLESDLSMEEFAGIMHDDLENPTSLGYLDRYNICYQQFDILTMLVTQDNARAIESLELWKDSVDYQLEEAQTTISNQQMEIEELKNEIAILKAQVA